MLIECNLRRKASFTHWTHVLSSPTVCPILFWTLEIRQWKRQTQIPTFISRKKVEKREKNERKKEGREGKIKKDRKREKDFINREKALTCFSTGFISWFLVSKPSFLPSFLLSFLPSYFLTLKHFTGLK